MNPGLDRGRLLGFAAALYAAMLAVGLLWGVLRGFPARWWVFADAAGVQRALALGLLLGLLGVGVTLLLERSVGGIRELGERFGLVLREAGPREALLLALFSSVGEEVLFRGCLQEELGLWWATLAFAVVHVGAERVFLWWTASAFVFGLGMGLLYETQGGLLAPVVMHFTINAININVLARRARRRLERGVDLDRYAS